MRIYSRIMPFLVVKSRVNGLIDVANALYSIVTVCGVCLVNPRERFPILGVAQELYHAPFYHQMSGARRYNHVTFS